MSNHVKKPILALITLAKSFGSALDRVMSPEDPEAKEIALRGIEKEISYGSDTPLSATEPRLRDLPPQPPER